MARDELLFCKGDAFSVQEHQGRAMGAEIAGMDGNRLLNTNVDDLVTYIYEKFRIDVPVLDEAHMTAEEREARRDVSHDPRRFHMSGDEPIIVTGTEVIIEVPFSGDPQLFWVRPSQYDTAPPRGEVNGNTLTFRYWNEEPQGAHVKQAVEGWLGHVKNYLQWQRGSFQSFNDSIAGKARVAITQRREKLLANQSLVAGLGIPLKRRPGAPTTYTAPEIKRRIMPKLPPASAGNYKSEPIVEEAEYQHILGIIESMVKVMERSPKAFHGIDEEALRTHFLVQLNGHYEGEATGETFNYKGKTDILVRSGDRNIFIGECKFWGGPAKLTETIDQLLGYLSWRDSKAAILVFNRNKDFSKVIEAIPGIVKSHPNFQKENGRRGESAFRYAFRHKDDAAKILHLTVMAFDIPDSRP
jgi:hypothetical protein